MMDWASSSGWILLSMAICIAVLVALFARGH